MTNPQGLHEMSRVIGGLQNAVENMTRIWQAQEISASEGRRLLHDKIEAVRDEVRDKLETLRSDFSQLSAEVENVSNDLSEIKPAISEFKDQRQQQIGAKALGVRLWGVIVTGAGLAGYGVHEFVGYWFHK